MKKTGLLLIIICCLTGCYQGTGNTSITGVIKGLSNDTLYLYAINGTIDQIDTIIAKSDKFSYKLTIDTITTAYLHFKNGTEHPVFLNKGNHIKINGDIAHLNELKIKGNLCDEEYTDFKGTLQKLSIRNHETERKIAGNFIKQHNTSYISIYLLEKYFVEADSIEVDKMRELIKSMTGTLQDNLYITKLSESLDRMYNASVGKYASYFNLPDGKGKRIIRTSDEYKNKVILLQFWASWSDSCHTANNKLRRIYKAYNDNKNFKMISVSFDMDKKTWENAIKKDTLKWKQTIETESFNSSTAQNFAIQQLPTTIIISKDGKIAARGNLSEQALKKAINRELAAKPAIINSPILPPPAGNPKRKTFTHNKL